MATYLDFVQVISGGTTILGLSVAWLGIYQQYKTNLDLRRSEKKCFLESLSIELSNIENWIGHYPTETVAFWWGYSNVQDWKMPFAKVVYPFGHDLVKTGVREGIHKGLSPTLVHELTILEQSILIFECILDLLRRLAYANPTLSWTLTQKIRGATTGTVILTQDELALMMHNFELNRFLHVECIGNNDETKKEGQIMPNENTAQNGASDEKPADSIDNSSQNDPPASSSQQPDTAGHAQPQPQGTPATTPGTQTDVTVQLDAFFTGFESRLIETIKTSIKAGAKESISEEVKDALAKAMQDGLTAGLLAAQSKALTRKRNLYSSYKRTQELMLEEFASLEGTKQFKPPLWMHGFNIFVWILATIGAVVIISAFFHIPKISIETKVHVDEPVANPTVEKQPDTQNKVNQTDAKGKLEQQSKGQTK